MERAIEEIRDSMAHAEADREARRASRRGIAVLDAAILVVEEGSLRRGATSDSGAAFGLLPTIAAAVNAPIPPAVAAARTLAELHSGLLDWRGELLDTMEMARRQQHGVDAGFRNRAWPVRPIRVMSGGADGRGRVA